MLKPLCPNWQHNSLLCFLLVTAVHCHVLTIFASSQYCWLLLCTATCYFRIKPVLLVTAARCHADSFCIKSVLLVTAVHCHMLTVFASSQYSWLLLCTATCWLFSHQVSTLGHCCALPHAIFASSQYCWLLLCTATCCFRIKSVLLVTAVHCHMLTVFALSQYCWLLLHAATCWLFSHQVTTVGYCCALPHADCFRISTLYSIQVRLCSTSLCTKLRRASAESEKPAQFREGIQNEH